MLALHKGLGTFIWQKLGWLWFGCTRFLMEKAAENAKKQKAKRAARAKAAAEAQADEQAATGEGETKKNVEPTVEAPPPEAPHGAAVKIATSAIITAVCTDLVGFIQIESSLPMHSRHWSPNPD